MKLQELKKKRVNAFAMRYRCDRITTTTIQKTKKFTKQIQLFHDEENPDDG